MVRFKIFRWLAKKLSVSTIRKVLSFLDHYIGGLFRRLEDHHLFLAAAGIAFSLFISIIPFVLLTFSVLSHIIPAKDILHQINTLIDNLIPYPAYAQYTKEFILKRMPNVVEFKTTAAYLGSFGLLFTTTWLFSSIRTVLNGIYSVTTHKSAWIGLLRDFGMVILLIFFVLISNFILPILNILVSAADKIEFLSFFRLSFLMDTVLNIVSIIIIFVMFFAFYFLIPYESLGKKVPVISAFWATVLWRIAAIIFGYYVTNYLSIHKIYGAFILVAVVAFWVFYSSILFVVGAEIGQLYRERNILNKNLSKAKEVE